MKKFLVMAIVALSMVLASCGIQGGGINNQPVCDDQAGTINGHAYDKVTPKCWLVKTWWKADGSDPEDFRDETDEDYQWGTEYDIRKTLEYWKAGVNVSASAYGVWYRSSGDFTMEEAEGRTDETCYDTYGI